MLRTHGSGDHCLPGGRRIQHRQQGPGANAGPAASAANTMNLARRQFLHLAAAADVTTHLLGMGVEPMRTTAPEFGTFIAAETKKWAKVVKFAGIKPD
jgi:hypothetical protein